MKGSLVSFHLLCCFFVGGVDAPCLSPTHSGETLVPGGHCLSNFQQELHAPLKEFFPNCFKYHMEPWINKGQQAISAVLM